MKKEDLLRIIAEDDLGLLSVKPLNSPAMTSDDRLRDSFLEINKFIEETGREPLPGGPVQEHRLFARLQSIREDVDKSKNLSEFDTNHLLGKELQKITSLKDVFLDDELGLLNGDDSEMFKMKNVPHGKDREAAEFIAHRKPCRDFKKYEQSFKECQDDLASGKRKLLTFTSDRQIKEKTFFVLNGILLFIDKIGETHIDEYGKMDGRQRCIFENGTESEMLLRSLVKRLYEDGKVVSENLETETTLFNQADKITDEDQKTGYIYILKSLSSNDKISSLKNLYKIGYSTVPVEERIKNAETDPTYLMAPVKIITTFECYNLNPQKMEQLLHNFFGDACLNADIFDKNNKRYTPREWFIAPLEVIEKAIALILNGEIVNYRYDNVAEKVVGK